MTDNRIEFERDGETHTIARAVYGGRGGAVITPATPDDLRAAGWVPARETDWAEVNRFMREINAALGLTLTAPWEETVAEAKNRDTNYRAALTSVDELKIQRDNARDAVEKLKAERDKWEAAYNKERERCTDALFQLQTEFADRPQSVGEILDEVIKLKAERDELKRWNEQQAKKVRSLEKLLDRYESSAEEADELRDERDAALLRIQELEKEQSHMRADRDSRIDERNSINADREQLRTERDDLRAKLDSSQAALQRWIQDCNNQISRANGVESEALDLRAKLEQAEKARRIQADDFAALADGNGGGVVTLLAHAVHLKLTAAEQRATDLETCLKTVSDVCPKGRTSLIAATDNWSDAAEAIANYIRHLEQNERTAGLYHDACETLGCGTGELNQKVSSILTRAQNAEQRAEKAERERDAMRLAVCAVYDCAGGDSHPFTAEAVRKKIAWKIARALEVPKVWSDVELDAMSVAYHKASVRHGHYETMMAIGAALLRCRKENLCQSSGGSSECRQAVTTAEASDSTTPPEPAPSDRADHWYKQCQKITQDYKELEAGTDRLKEELTQAKSDLKEYEELIDELSDILKPFDCSLSKLTATARRAVNTGTTVLKTERDRADSLQAENDATQPVLNAALLIAHSLRNNSSDYVAQKRLVDAVDRYIAKTFPPPELPTESPLDTNSAIFRPRS